ncbi:MAG: hypothetical protein CMM86_03585 [Rhodovulum sp.]|nr:hypothetical protein [Rhodovulum sp.]|tara:strand:- start:4851 stop:5657 length:807 start_codon:yes stop_codon:yes gene_type:complete
MAQKTDANSIRGGISSSSNFLYSPRKSNTAKNCKEFLSVENTIKRFYRRLGYQTTSFYLEKNSHNLLINVQLSLIVPNKLNKPKELKNRFISLPSVVSSSETSRSLDPQSFYVESDTSDKMFLWSRELNVLCSSLFKELGLYIAVIKSNLLSPYLVSSEEITGYSLSRFIKNQIVTADSKRQRLNLKPYMDKIVDTLGSSNQFQGVRIQLKGRLPSGGSGNKAGRSKKEVSASGNIPLQTICSHVDYASTDFSTKSGTCGIKVWIHHN